MCDAGFEKTNLWSQAENSAKLIYFDLFSSSIFFLFPKKMADDPES